MDRYYTQAVGTPVFTTAGVPVTKVVDVVIEPETGKIAGFLLAPGGHYVIAPADVLFWEQHIFIHDQDDILETGEIIKVQEILQKNLPIFRAKVYTKSGKYVGKVYDMALDSKLFVMTKLVIAKNILGLFPFDEKIISTREILEIKKDRIIIKDIDATVRAKEKASAKENLQIDIAPSACKKL